MKQKEMEKVAHLAEKDRLDKERMEARKRREVQRITDERRREDRRRVDPRSVRDDMNGDDEFDSDMRYTIVIPFGFCSVHIHLQFSVRFSVDICGRLYDIF